MSAIFRNNNWIDVLLFGSLWGISEVFVENFLVPVCLIPRAIILTTIAIGILAAARTGLQQRGSILAVGMVAALYKFLNIQFFGCQMLALVMLAGTFEIIYAWLGNRNVSRGIIGAVTVLFFNTAFALVATFILRNQWWVSGGLSKSVRFIFLEGSITAVLAAGMFILGEMAGNRLLQSRAGWALTAIRSFNFVSIILAVSVAVIAIML